jgi:hypothetical protein
VNLAMDVKVVERSVRWRDLTSLLRQKNYKYFF